MERHAASGLFQEDTVELDLRMPDALPAVHADRDRLMQVIVNLLSNAVKFCDQRHGRVVVEARAGDEGVQVSVADNGPGLRPEDRQLIFEKFQQAGEVLTQRPPGTGLGLPICRQIVEHFGGRIWVQSNPGQGTRFAFTIPYAHRVETAPAPVAE